jgi:SdrD B-like domain
VVWIDTNANGLVDAGEQVMPGVTVRVTAGGIVKEAVTDGLGRYSFLDINCGDVTVEIISGLPAGTPLPAPKTIRVLGESAEAPLLVPFGVQLPTAAEVAYGGAESRQFLAAALTFLGMGGLLVSRKRKESGLRR